MTRYQILDELLASRYHHHSLDDLTDRVSQHLQELYGDSHGAVRRTIEKELYYLEYEGPFNVEIERYTVSTYCQKAAALCQNVACDAQIPPFPFSSVRPRERRRAF